jgi:hypothetical protein
MNILNKYIKSYIYRTNIWIIVEINDYVFILYNNLNTNDSLPPTNLPIFL